MTILNSDNLIAKIKLLQASQYRIHQYRLSQPSELGATLIRPTQSGTFLGNLTL